MNRRRFALLPWAAAFAMVALPLAAQAAPNPADKLAAKCARLAAAKDKQVHKALRYESMCTSPAAGDPQSGSGENPGAPTTPSDEILDLPPVFTPSPGGSGHGVGGESQDGTSVLDTPVADVPEPTSLTLLGLGLLGLGVLRRRRR